MWSKPIDRSSSLEEDAGQTLKRLRIWEKQASEGSKMSPAEQVEVINYFRHFCTKVIEEMPDGAGMESLQAREDGDSTKIWRPNDNKNVNLRLNPDLSFQPPGADGYPLPETPTSLPFSPFHTSDFMPAGTWPTRPASLELGSGDLSYTPSEVNDEVEDTITLAYNPPITQVQQDYLVAVLESLFNSNDGVWFAQPVDEKKHNAPGYYKTILNPIDLDTMAGKLESGKYSHVKALSNDVALMVNNAEDYNGYDHDIAKAARRLMKKYEKRLSGLPIYKKEDLASWRSIESIAEKRASAVPLVQPSSKRPRNSLQFMLPAVSKGQGGRSAKGIQTVLTRSIEDMVEVSQDTDSETAKSSKDILPDLHRPKNFLHDTRPALQVKNGQRTHEPPKGTQEDPIKLEDTS